MAKIMNILMVSTSYPADAEDWRGRFIFDMAQALGKKHNLKISLWAPPGELPPYINDASTTADRQWLDNLMQHGGIANLLREKRVTGLRFAAGLLQRLYRTYRRESVDLVHVNWLQNAIPLIGTDTPALITVLGRDYGLLNTPGIIPLLRTTFKKRRTILAPNADWMIPGLEKAFGDLTKISAVPFGVDKRWFAIDRKEAEPGCWLAVTRITREKIGDLFSWGARLFEKRKLHLFGPMQEQLELPPWINWHGPTHPSELANNWFPNATGLITLSRHDEGRPQVMLEAMAAGLPIIASNIPAHRNLISHTKNGLLINNHREMASALYTLENMENNRYIGEAARMWIKQNIGDWDDCATRYAALYDGLQTS